MRFTALGEANEISVVFEDAQSLAASRRFTNSLAPRALDDDTVYRRHARWMMHAVIFCW